MEYKLVKRPGKIGRKQAFLTGKRTFLTSFFFYKELGDFYVETPVSDVTLYLFDNKVCFNKVNHKLRIK